MNDFTGWIAVGAALLLIATFLVDLCFETVYAAV